MSERAQVTSVEALEAFRASLLVYLSKARPALEEMCDDVRRTRIWLETDRQTHWEHEARRRRRELEQAQQELLSARLSGLSEPTTAQQWAVARAHRALVEAEEKLRLVRKWRREFDDLTEPLTKHLDQVLSLLNQDMRQAAAYLAQTVSTLQAYAQIASPAPGVEPAPLNSPAESPAAAESAPVPAASGPAPSHPSVKAT